MNPILRPQTLCFALVLAACGQRDPRFGLSMATLPPVAAGSALFYVQPALDRAVVVDTGTTDPTVRSVALGTGAALAVPRAAHAEALVLSRGERGSDGVDPAPASLAAVTATGTARRWTLDAPFTALAQSDDGRWALATFDPHAVSERLLFNPNELALVDLDAAPSATNPVVRTVRSFGGVPQRVVFSPAMVVAGERRVLAVVLSDAYVTLLDLAHPDRSEVTVRLTLPEDTRAVAPSQVLFDVDNATIYLRADASNDLYVMRLVQVTPASATSEDFRPALNQLAAGTHPSDMALTGTAAARRVLVVSPGSQDARLLDTVANTSTVLPLSAPANHILLFGADATAPATTALLYGTNGVASAVSFVALTDLAARRSLNVETLQLGRTIGDALPLPERKVVLFSHPSGTTGSLSLLDLSQRTAAPIYSEASLGGARFDGDRQTVWVAPDGLQRLGYIDLDGFRPGEVRLDAAATDVVALGGAARRVAALHAGAEGWFTLIDGAQPTRAHARSVRGFLLEGLLDEGAQ